MAVMHVEIDIDGDVYPELYAALTALRQPMLRDERMRQLAAMGLAWEAVRIRGPEVLSLAAKPAAPAPAPAIERPAPSTRSTPRAAAKSPARKTGSRSSAPADTVQLPVLVDIVSKSPDEAAPADAVLAADDGPVPTVDPVPVNAASRGAGNRSRLQRMKDRGLFKND